MKTIAKVASYSTKKILNRYRFFRFHDIYQFRSKKTVLNLSVLKEIVYYNSG